MAAVAHSSVERGRKRGPAAVLAHPTPCRRDGAGRVPRFGAAGGPRSSGAARPVPDTAGRVLQQRHAADDRPRADPRRPRAGSRLALASRTTLSDNVPGDMFWYARGVGDSALASYWHRRLETETPRSPFAAQNRAGAIWSRLWHDKDSLRALADMDRLWDDVGPAHGNLVNLGWRVAQIVGDSAGLVRGASHYLDMNRADSAWIATAFTRYSRLRNEGMRLLRQELHALDTPDDARRSLEHTVEEQRAADAAKARALLAVLGQALVASGHATAGLHTPHLAGRQGGDVRLLPGVARPRPATRDTAGALTLLAVA